MRIAIVAVIVALASRSADAANQRPEPAATVAQGGKIAYCKTSSLGDDRARIRIVLTSTSITGSELVVPLTIPEGFVVTGLSLSMTGEEAVVGKLRPATVARETYETIVRQLTDPALLEWTTDRYAVLRVFPVTRSKAATVTLELAARSTVIGARLGRKTSLVAVPASAVPETEGEPDDLYVGYWPAHVVEPEVVASTQPTFGGTLRR